MELHELSLTNRDSQWLESLDFNAIDICRFFGVPAHMIGIRGEDPADIEQTGIEFVRFTLHPLACRFEEAADRDLLLDPDKHFTRFDLDEICNLLHGTPSLIFLSPIFLSRSSVMDHKTDPKEISKKSPRRKAAKKAAAKKAAKPRTKKPTAAPAETPVGAPNLQEAPPAAPAAAASTPSPAAPVEAASDSPLPAPCSPPA